MKIKESQLRKIIRECLLLEYNGSDAIEDAENSGYEDGSSEFEDILANGRSSKYYHHNIDEDKLRHIVRESISQLLLKENYGNVIYGYGRFIPYDELEKCGLDLSGIDEGGELYDLLTGEYDITFEGYASYNGGDYYTPPESHISRIHIYSGDNEIKNTIAQIESISPELGNEVKECYQDWLNMVMDGYDTELVSWNWDNVSPRGYND